MAFPDLPIPVGAWRSIWLGSAGPFWYDDGADVGDPDLEYNGITAPLQSALITDAQINVGAAPVEDYEALRLIDVGALVGNVVGPAASTDNAIVRWDGVSGKSVDNSVVIIDNTGNITGVVNLTASGMVRQGGTWHAFGGFEDQAETVVCGVGDWNHITNGGNTLWGLDEADGISEAADVFTLTNSGDYGGTLSLSISAINGKDFHVRVYNNTQTRVEGRGIGISTTGAGNEMNVCVPIHIEGTAGDEIQFEVMSADGTDVVVDDGLFTLAYLHD